MNKPKLSEISEEVKSIRTPAYPISPLFLNRWSPRAMTGEEISDTELFSLFEAAHWAPSSYNNQPWRIAYAKRETPEWPLLFNLLMDGNKQWCKNAAALVVFFSRNTFEHNNKPARTHSYDTGAAWMSMALEGYFRGLVVHGMEGFDWEKARKDLEIPEGYSVEAMAAIGKRAAKSTLPEEIAKREAPSTRKPLEEVVFNGKFKKSPEKKTSKS